MDASETITAAEACAFEFPDDQGKNYRKTDFILHSRVAEVVGDQMGRVFYDDDDDGEDSWSIGAGQLRNMVLTNILQEDDGGDESFYSKYPIYGSAIAFEPGIWTDNTGLDEGVTYPAASMACLEDVSYCSPEAAADIDNLRLMEMNLNDDGMPIYCPYAFRGPSQMSVYSNCSRGGSEFCPSMDLAFAYDYSNITTSEAEWYTAPRCLYLRDGIRSGYWTSPYFDDGAGNINMVTYSQPLISRSGKFLGVTTIDVAVDALCYGDQCNKPIDYNYLTKIRPVGLTFATIAMASSFACGIWTMVNHKDRVVIASQPLFLRLICIGCLVMSSSIIPLSIDDSIASSEGCSKACMAFPWLLSIGFTTTFAALFSKTWRLNRVVGNARRMRRVTVKEKDVILPFAILMTINFILMLLWTLTDPLVWVRTEPNDKYESQGHCQAEGKLQTVFLALIVIVNAFALILAIVEAFRARHLSTEFSDAFYVMMTMVSLLQALVIGIPLVILVNDISVAKYFVWSGLIFVLNMAILGFMFVPKMDTARRRAKDGTTGNSSGYPQQAHPNTQHRTIPNDGHTGAEQAPTVVIISSRDAQQSGNPSIVRGKF